jgi:hypothetical protein
MTRLRSATLAFALAALATASFGCKKDQPKAETQKAEEVPVPSGLVFNDFLPANGTATGLGVRDAGGDGGLGNVAGGEEPGGGEAAEPSDKLAVKLIDPGAEPRAARKYTFVANKVDKRVLTLTRSISQSAGGQAAPPQEITVKLALDLKATQVKPTGATVEAKITKVELPGAPPQVAPMLAAMNGLTGTFEVSNQGEVGEVSFAGSQAMQAQQQLAQQVMESLSQGIQLLLAPLPTAPVGVGAKWELATKSETEQGAKRFTLKEVSNEGGVVDSDIEIKVPRRANRDPRGGTVYVEIDGKGRYTQQLRFNQTSPKAEGELTVNEKLEMGDAKSGGKQTVVQTQKAKQVLEAPAK